MFTFLFVNHAVAGPGLTTYQAKIIKPDGLPLEASGVNFRFTILNPAGSCVLYIEDYSSVNMASTGGLISFSLGTGTKIYPTSGTVAFADVFSNATPSIACQGAGSFNPSANDVRKIVMQFNDSTGWQTLPAMNINAVPYAMYANLADNTTLFNNKADTAFVQYSSIPTCTASQALQYTGSGFVCIAAGGGSGGASYTVTSSDVTTALGYTPANPATLSSSFTTTASFSTVTATVNSLGSSVTAITSTVNGLSASFAAITSSQWVSSGTAIHYTAGNVGIGTNNPTTLFQVNWSPSANWEIQHEFDPLSNGPTLKSAFDLGGAGEGRFNFIKARGTIANPAGVLQNDFLGTISFRGVNTSGTLLHAALIRAVAGQDFANTSAGSHLVFQTSSSGTASPIERLRIDSQGYVGVGTTVPVTKLDVAGAIRISMETATCAASYAGAIRYNSGVVEFCNGTTWSTFTAGSVTSSSVISALGYTPANSSTMATSFATVTSSLSTLSSSYTALQASVTALASGSSVTSSSVISALGYTPANSNQIYWTASGTGIRYTAGDVGIGTNNPVYRLDVSGTSRITGPALFGNNPAVSGTFDFGFAFGGVVPFKAPLFIQETQTDLNDLYTFGQGTVLNLNPASVAGNNVTTGALNFVQTDAVNPINYQSIYGHLGIAQHNGPGSLNLLQGVYGIAVNNSVGGIGEVRGIQGGAYHYGSGSVINNIAGEFSTANASAGTITNNFGIKINSAVGLMASNFGLYVADQSMAVASATYNIYSEGSSARNIFFGPIGAGLHNPSARLHLSPGSTTLATMKFTTGSLLTSATPGAFEYDGTNLYFTNGTSVRRAIVTGTSGSITSSTITTALGYTPVSAAGATQWTTSATTINFMTGNVGIGTTNPTVKLEVNGDAKFGTKVTAGTFISDQYSYGAAYTVSSTSFDNAPQGDSNGVFMKLMNTSSITGTGSFIYLNPKNGAQKSYIGAIATSAGNSPAIVIGRKTGASAYQESVRIDENGNLGVGSSAPGGRLSIESSGVPGIQIKTTGAAAVDTFNMVNDMNATGYFWMAKGTSASAAPTSANRLVGVTNEGAVEIYGQAVNAGTDNSGILSLKTQASGDGGTKNEVSMEFYADRTDLNTSSGFLGYENGTAFDLSLMNNKAGNMFFGTSGTTDIAINSSGNVGIGTTAQTSKLQVRQAASESPFRVDKADGTSIMDIDWAGRITMDTNVNSTVPMLTVGNGNFGGRLLVLNGKTGNTNNLLEAKHNSIDKFVVTYTGATGIGTSAPTTMLHIASSGTGTTRGLRIETTQTNLNSVFAEAQFKTDAREWRIGVGGASETTYGVPGKFYIFDSGTNSMRMTLDGSGNVGIGTATPSTLNAWGRVLDVAGVAHSKIVATQDTAGVSVTTGIYSHGLTGNGYAGYLQGHGGVGLLGTETYHDLGLITSNTARISITKAGFVGIGNTSPTVNFEVGSSAAGGGTMKLSRQNLTGAEGGELQFAAGTTGDDIFTIDNYNSGASQVFRFRSVANSSIMNLTPGGNVGIGIANPTYLLQLGSDSAAKPGTNTWTIASDMRLKDSRAPFTRGIDELLGLNTIYFTYKKDNALGLPSDKEYVGIRAQDAQKVIPESVTIDEKGFLHFTSDAVFWTAVNSIKQLYHKLVGHDAVLEKHEREIASVKAESAAKDQKIKELEERLQKIEKTLQQQNK